MDWSGHSVKSESSADSSLLSDRIIVYCRKILIMTGDSERVYQKEMHSRSENNVQFCFFTSRHPGPYLCYSGLVSKYGLISIRVASLKSFGHSKTRSIYFDAPRPDWVIKSARVTMTLIQWLLVLYKTAESQGNPIQWWLVGTKISGSRRTADSAYNIIPLIC